ncbi:hypothetical protein SLEP1_g47331 [Rubroshorea leprosula]|uniref:Transmembrane protein n=1 Tax=Rubroshorea leprosula TaxID=152421 RepID=A0AAV5LQ63_9ROSI|nr:hypothetical protein SLEP1_g47331 [Rubroshorea leprosula]
MVSIAGFLTGGRWWCDHVVMVVALWWGGLEIGIITSCSRCFCIKSF